jgi:hypothetical protein
VTKQRQFLAFLMSRANANAAVGGVVNNNSTTASTTTSSTLPTLPQRTVVGDGYQPQSKLSHDDDESSGATNTGSTNTTVSPPSHRSFPSPAESNTNSSYLPSPLSPAREKLEHDRLPIDVPYARELGSGSSGRVYAATYGGKAVVVKVYQKSKVDYQKELKTLRFVWCLFCCCCFKKKKIPIIITPFFSASSLISAFRANPCLLTFYGLCDPPLQQGMMMGDAIGFVFEIMHESAEQIVKRYSLETNSSLLDQLTFWRM